MDNPPAIHTDQGLKRLRGNRVAYRRLLDSFADQFGGAEERLRDHLRRGDAPGAFQLAHTLKGVAANLGALDIAAAAGALADRLRRATQGPPDPSAECPADLGAALAAALDQIGRIQSAAEWVDTGAPSPRLSIGAGEAPRKDRPTLLIVDDDPGNIDMLAFILTPIYRTIPAKGGAEALEKARRKPQPDLILLDVIMPEMDGYAVCRSLKADPLTRAIPVIFITAMSAAEDVATGLDIGAVDYISRPLTPAIVLARVKNHLELAQARLESEHRYKTLFDSVGDGIAIHDFSGQLLEVNQRLCQSLGYRRNELLAMSVAELCVPLDGHPPSYTRPGQDAPRNSVFECIHRTRSGERLTVEVRSQIIEYEGRKAVLNIARDLTERKRTEARLAAAENELAEQRALRMRTDRLRSLGEMAAGIAHELNQPLVGVRGIAEHLLIAMERGWDLTPERTRERLGAIIDQADRMTHIIEHVRLFAREAGKPETQEVNVNEVVSSAMGMMSAQLRSKGIGLKLIPGMDLPDVRINPFSLEEVIINLLTNSRDAMETSMTAGSDKEKAVSFQDGIRIETDTQADEKGAVARIIITDHGSGIPAEMLTRIFDPFFTTKGPDRGTGLGLAISSHLIAQAGGDMKIESTPGHRTRAIIRLPAAEAEGTGAGRLSDGNFNGKSDREDTENG